MATRDQLIEALKRADAAGDTEGARTLAKAVQDMDAQGSEPDLTSGSGGLRRQQQPAAAPAPAPAPMQEAAPAPAPEDKRSWGQWAADKLGGIGTGIANVAAGVGAQILPVGAAVQAAGGDRSSIDEAAARAAKYESTIGQGLVNLPGSALHMIGSIVGAAAHPLDTASAIGTIASKVATDPAAAAKGIFNYFGDRYGDEDHLLKTIREDPAGLLMDIATAATGVGGAARGVAMGAGRAGLTGIEAGANAVADVAKVGARATDPFRVTGKVLSAPANAMRQVGRGADAIGMEAGVGNAFRKAGNATDVTAGIKYVAGRTTGGAMSIIGRKGGEDAARRMLTTVVPDGQMPAVLKALREAPDNMTAREALANAGVDADIVQAVGKAIEEGPGASWFGRRAYVKAKEATDAELKFVTEQNAKKEAQGNDQAVERSSMNADHEEDLAQLKRDHDAELEQHHGDSQDKINEITARQAAEVEALQDMHDMVKTTVGGDLKARQARLASARHQAIARLDESARGTLDDIAGGADATAARQSVDAAKKGLNDPANPISQAREEALAQANVGNDNIPGMRQTAEEGRARAADQTAKAKTAFAGSDRLRAQAEDLGANNRPLEGAGRSNAEAMWRELTGGEEMPLTATMEDLNRLRERAGGVERMGDKLNAGAHEAAGQARDAEERIAGMKADGVGELNGKSIADRIRAKANERPGNITLHKALTKMADAIERVSAGGAIRAEDLYDLRKDGVGSVADKLKSGFAERSASERQVMGAVPEVKSFIDDAIEAAGGVGWRKYLSDYEAASNPINQQRFAGKLRRMSDKDVVATVRGENPEAVGKAFNGNYDVSNAMSDKLGNGANNHMTRLTQAGDDLALKASKEARAAQQMRNVQTRHASQMDQLQARQKTVMDQVKERQARELSDAKAAKVSGEQTINSRRPGDITGVQARHKIEMDALKDRQMRASKDLEASQAKDLEDYKERTGALGAKMSRQAEMGRFEADEITKGASLGKGARVTRAVAGILINTRGARVAEVAKVFADAKIGKAMKVALVDAFQSGKNMEKLLTSLTPSQRAAVLAQSRKFRTVAGLPGQQVSQAHDRAEESKYQNYMRTVGTPSSN